MKCWKRAFTTLLLSGVLFITLILSYFNINSSHNVYIHQLPSNENHHGVIPTTARTTVFSNLDVRNAKSSKEYSIIPIENSSNSTSNLSSVNACSDNHCISLLSLNELVAFKRCENIVATKTGQNPEDIRPTCKFMNGTKRKVVGLVSETGSGNTWVRGLLERATGVCTGAIYCDAALRNSGMIGEYVIGSSVLVVKTHTPDYQWVGVSHPNRQADYEHTDAHYGSAILLIRNPFDAFVSEWNRFVLIQKIESAKPGNAVRRVDESHTYRLGKEMFGTNKQWDQFLKTISKRWYNVYTRWYTSAIDYNVPILVVRYEDVKMDKIGQVERMLKFLDFKFDRTELSQRLNQDFTAFQRSHNNSEQFNHYTPRQVQLVNSVVYKAIQLLGRYGATKTFMLENYLKN